jgi:3-oxoacyl-[acyl-carrier protein] reductase
VNDYLLDLSRNPLAKRLVRQLKLPIPLPEPLQRATGPTTAQELAGVTLAVGGGRGTRLGDLLKGLVTGAGAEVAVDYAAGTTLDGMVYDATPFATIGDLGGLYDFIKPRLASLAPCARVVVLGTEHDAARTPEGAAISGALLGFVKSLAKELGRRGGTCQLLWLTPDAAGERLLSGPLQFFLSRRSAFVSGQALTLTPPAADAGVQAAGGAWQLPLTGKVALVTGAAQGIGAAIARRLAADGAKVLCLDRPQEKAALDAVANEAGGQSLVFDLLDPNAAKAVAKRLEADVGHLDILVNNAGITRDKTLQRMPRDWWDDTLAINLAAPVRLTEALVFGEPSLLKLLNEGGRILFLSSIGGLAGNFGQTNYATAKAGVASYVRALAPRLAPRGITVNALAPGFIETRMTKAMPIGMREVARRLNALSQAGLPEDVAEAAAFLAAPAAASVTGGVLRVCGLNLMGA